MHGPKLSYTAALKGPELSPALEDKLAFTVTATQSYQAAAEVSAKWGTPVSDSTVHRLTQRLGAKAESRTQQRLKEVPREPAAYQQQVLPEGLPIFGLTAGLPVTLAGLVGCRGRTWGWSSFGYSAPAKVLDEKLGFTPANVYEQVVAYLADYKK